MTSRADLVADCSACVGLCCVVPAFSVSSDFALDKPAGVPCPHLGGDHRCTVHDRLPELGFRGCTVYDCFGAGQRVVRDGGGDLHARFEVVERLHELLWYAADALDRTLPRPLREEVTGFRDRVEAAAQSPGDADVLALQLRADGLLGEVSAAVRRPAGRSHRGADLAGRDLRDHDLAAADLRGVVLLGADLRDVDLTDADLLGTDVRGADLRGADLRTALFATRLQVRSARVDDGTRLPAWAG